MLKQMTGWLKIYLQKSVVQILIPCSSPESKLIFLYVWKSTLHKWMAPLTTQTEKKIVCTLHLKTVWIPRNHTNEWTRDRSGDTNASWFQDKRWWLFTQYTIQPCNSKGKTLLGLIRRLKVMEERYFGICYVFQLAYCWLTWSQITQVIKQVKLGNILGTFIVFSQHLHHLKLGFFSHSKPQGQDKLASYLPKIKSQQIFVISVIEIKYAVLGKLDE